MVGIAALVKITLAALGTSGTQNAQTAQPAQSDEPQAENQRPVARRAPIIDMHLHALPADWLGKIPTDVCAIDDGPDKEMIGL
jgi:hypothetical protein